MREESSTPKWCRMGMPVAQASRFVPRSDDPGNDDGNWRAQNHRRKSPPDLDNQSDMTYIMYIKMIMETYT